MSHREMADWGVYDLEEKRSCTDITTNVQSINLNGEKGAAIFFSSKTQPSLNQNPTQEEHLSSLIKDQPARY